MSTKVIIKEPCSGKTTDIIKLCHENGGQMVCFSRVEAERVYREAAEFDRPIHMPITFREFMGADELRRWPKVYIDNLDLCLRRHQGIEICAVTFDK